jgi:SP family arabinose:H+ symporter-like MFS transporter
MYIAEIAPAQRRGRMVSINQFAIVSGILAAYFINLFIAAYGDASGPEWNVEHGWRWMFGFGVLPAILFLVLLLLVPESPRWLSKQGRAGQAESILARINGPEIARAELASIQRVDRRRERLPDAIVRARHARGTRVRDRAGRLQQITGINVFLYFAPEIFKKMAPASTRH